ncbi:helix-turn-helix domain-containing protein [Spiribacter halobius]|uniref:HTH cro/C1-type domain-containing protein n=1 Tax=Sediminicurvatus halobius TaxID=2182432 RepID=A0A2U2N9E8_9GAMM|nr:helix-turn-helix transcriptional regulator [Spiribacter halobius]PWG65697.1 hypothetical protein DEM34_00015 [Spiribacter halobius]UEX77732.1 helix-turn-helix domain-containing protein [Spiribacter halobius]
MDCDAYELLDQLAKRPATREAMRRSALALELGRLAFDMRSAAGLSQAQLAKRLGTSRTVISRLEGGNAGRVPGLDQIDKIAEACGFEVRLEATRMRPEAGAETAEVARFRFSVTSAAPSTAEIPPRR